jgi:hypothetical protein
MSDEIRNTMPARATGETGLGTARKARPAYVLHSGRMLDGTRDVPLAMLHRLPAGIAQAG